MTTILNRDQVPIEETWDLGDLFATEEEFNQALEKLHVDVDAYVDKFEGKIKEAKDINQALDEARPIFEGMGQVGSYANLAVEVDVRNTENAQRLAKTANDLASMDAKLAFIDPEISNLDQEILKEAMESSDENQTYIEKLLKKKDHLLTRDTEAALASLGPILDAPFQTYSDIKFSDTQFPKFNVQGQEYEMTYNTFENHLESETDTDLRRSAFHVFHEELDRHKHGTASVYNTQVQKEKIMANLRGYDSVFDMLLDRQEVPRELHDRQIDIIMDKLAPAMRKYAKLLGKVHNLDRVTSADLKIDLDPTYVAHVSFEETQAYILEGLSVLGDEYQEILKNAFQGRWIDYAENRGKRTGAFCSSPYGVHPYILSSFNSKMDEVMTMAHELGHAGHSVLAGRNQNIYNVNTSMYFVESPSTANEIIMENYLLKQAGGDKRRRRWILSQMISKTYYHNFVTHLLEAAYQREVYKMVDDGKSVNADILSDIYRQVLEDFWGEDVEILEGASLTWMRQLHYYRGLYSYTYSAGLTIGTQVARRIMEEGDQVAKEWIQVLKAGGSQDSIALAQMVGVDIRTDQPLLDTIAYISQIVDEIVDLTEELEA